MAPRQNMRLPGEKFATDTGACNLAFTSRQGYLIRFHGISCVYIYIYVDIYIYMSCSWKKEKHMINERIYTYNIYTYKSQFFSQHYPVNQPKLWERGALKRCSQLTYVIYYVSI